MIGMAKRKPPAATGDSKKKRNVVFVTLDDVIEGRLVRFIDRQRIRPDRAAVALTALVEFLDREEAKEKKPKPADDA